MTQGTNNKFAAILAAAQAKANIKATPSFKQPEAIQPEPPAEPMPELSTFTIEDILTGYEPADDQPELCQPMTFELPAMKQQPQPALKIVDYSPKSFAILTASKPSEDILNVFRLHGTYNQHLKCGKGWIFSKRHLAAIKEKLGL